MSLINWAQPPKLTSRRNWVENFFAETDDFFKTANWDTSFDVPAINVKDEPKFYFIEVAAPGMKKEDFKITVENGILLITSKTESMKEEKKESFLRKEFNYRNFSRSFWLPETVDANAIKAKYEDGMLKLELPKINVPERAKTRSINIS